jgi:hypothetical protein
MDLRAGDPTGQGENDVKSEDTANRYEDFSGLPTNSRA